VHTDTLGTAHILSNQAGEVAWQAEYSPFGKATLLVEDVVFNHRLLGQWEDAETGTHYNYLRDYDPETGRYLTSDPFSVGGGLNTYLYANADPLNSVDVLGLMPNDSGEFPDLGGVEGYEITEEQYLELHGYASSNSGQQYFQMLFDITNHGVFSEFAESYNSEENIPGVLLLRELFMRNGMNEINQHLCTLDGPMYLIPEVSALTTTVFNTVGFGREVGGFVGDLWNTGVGLVNFAFDSTLGMHGDIQNMLAEYYGVPSMVLPAWYPSYDDAVNSLDELLVGSLDIVSNIIENHELIWQDIKDETVKDWTERRYAEVLTAPALEIASLFLTGGLSVAAKIDRATDYLIGARRLDTLAPGEFQRVYDQLAEELFYEPELLEEALARAGLADEAARLCSFAGHTLVSTKTGYLPIRDIIAGQDEVWARDETSGKTGWRKVLAHYSNQYSETVKVTARDNNGHLQTITSNRIHPYFARIAAGAVLVTASAFTEPTIASEGHIYTGEIEGGAWIDAQFLKKGDELLGDNNEWQTVENVVNEKFPLGAYNLTVAEYSTYFVAGD